MLLAIDVRNTHTVVGLISGSGSHAKVAQNWRIRTESEVTSDELALTIDGLIGDDSERLTGAAGLSTVPSVLQGTFSVAGAEINTYRSLIILVTVVFTARKSFGYVGPCWKSSSRCRSSARRAPARFAVACARQSRSSFFSFAFSAFAPASASK